MDSTSRTVLVVDEAGTAGTRDLARSSRRRRPSPAKVVLLGDPKQLPEIAAGGLFAGLIARQPMLELRDNHRQREEWERDALRQLRDGDPSAALAAYHTHDRITIGYDRRRHQSICWSPTGGRHASPATTRSCSPAADRRSPNSTSTAGSAPMHAGQLFGTTLEVDGIPFQAGDAVMTLRNDRRIGVRNGNRGVVARRRPRRPDDARSPHPRRHRPPSPLRQRRSRRPRLRHDRQQGARVDL